MKCSYCCESAEYKCACELPFMCYYHLGVHIFTNKNHPYEGLNIKLSEFRHRQLIINTSKILKKLKKARLEIAFKTKSLISLIEQQYNQAIKILVSINNICIELLDHNKFCESEMPKVEKFESLKISLQGLDIEDISTNIEKTYSKNFINYSKRCKYWETEFLEDHAQKFLCGAISGDGKILVTGGLDSTIRVWDFLQKKQKFVLHGHKDKVICITITGDSLNIISGSYDFSIRIWSLIEAKQVALLKGHSNLVLVLCYFDEESLIFSGDYNGQLLIWDFTKRTIIKRLSLPETINSLAIINTHKILIAGLANKIMMLDIKTGKLINNFVGHSCDISCLCLISDIKTLVSGSSDGMIIVWDLVEYKEIFKIKEQNSLLALASNEDFIVSGSLNYIGIWSLKDYNKVKEFYHNSSPVCILKTNKIFLMLFDELSFGLLDIYNQNFETSEYLRAFNQYSVSFSADSRLIGYGKGTQVIIWDMESKAVKYSLIGHKNTVYSVEISENGKFALSCSYGSENNFFYWNLENGIMITELIGNKECAYCASFSADGLSAASGSGDYTVRTWNLKEHKQDYIFYGHNDLIQSIKFIDKKSLLVSAGRDKKIIVWDLKAENQFVVFIYESSLINELNGQSNWISKIIVTDDEKYIISAAFNDGICIWNLNEKRLEMQFIYKEDAKKWLKGKKIPVESLGPFFKP